MNLKKSIILAFAIGALSATSAQALCPALSASELPQDFVVLSLKGGNTTLAKPATMGSTYRYEGMLLYNNTAKEVQVCDGTDWVTVTGGGGGGAGGGSDCVAEPVRWSQDGHQCSANAINATDGDVISVSDPGVTSPALCDPQMYLTQSGSANFICEGGRWRVTGSATCNGIWKRSPPPGGGCR